MRRHSPESGQTILLTLILVAALLLIAVFVVAPNFVRARGVTSKPSCINNLRQIDGAKEQWSLENKIPDLSPANTAQVCLYIKGGMPECPEGGAYHFNVIGLPPQCSQPRHVLYYNSPCSENLEFLNKAVLLWLREHPGHSASNLVETNLFGFGNALDRVPDCPGKGRYALNREKGVYACSESAP